MKTIRHYLLLFFITISTLAIGQNLKNTQQWKVFETSFESSKSYPNPFMDVQVDVVFKKDGKSWKIPAFWDGENIWKVRFAPPEQGNYTYQVVSSDKSKVGARAGRPRSENGYWQVTLKGKTYYAHRLAWLHVYGAMPTKHIDHVNGFFGRIQRIFKQCGRHTHGVSRADHDQL